MTADLLQKEEAEVGIVSHHRKVGLAGGKVGVPPVQFVRGREGRSKVGEKFWRKNGALPFSMTSFIKGLSLPKPIMHACTTGSM